MRLARFGVVGRDWVVGDGAVSTAQSRHAPGDGAEGS